MSIAHPLISVLAALIEQDVREAEERMKLNPVDTTMLRGKSRAELCVALAEQTLAEIIKLSNDPTADLADALRPIAGGLLITLNHYERENAPSH